MLESISLVIVVIALLIYNIYNNHQSRKYEKELIEKIINPPPVVYQPLTVGGVEVTDTEASPQPTVAEMLERLSKSKEEGISVV